MFCSNCGAQMDDDALFCPDCGTKVINLEESPKPQNQAQPKIVSEKVKTAPAFKSPGTPVSSGNSMGKYLGAGSALLAFISLFFKFFIINIPDDISSFMQFMGVRKGYGSWNLYQLMTEAEMPWLFWLTVVCIILVIVLQLTNHPKLSLLGCLGMLFTIFILSMATSEMPRQFRAFMKYGIGFYLFIISTVLCVVFAIVTRKKRK